MAALFKYFGTSLFAAAVGLIAAFFIGFYTGTDVSRGVTNGFQAVFVCAVLGVLEISLSFDNAVVNATVLGRMTPLWRRRFLTWGMLIAVFGMRLVFPLLITGIVAHLDPWSALRLATLEPQKYADIMTSAHIPISAFGGAFLLMVALKYFFNQNKDVHWLAVIETPLNQIGKLQAAEIAIGLVTIYGVSLKLNLDDAHRFLVSGIFGLITFIVIDGISTLLESRESAIAETGTPAGALSNVHRASVGMFIYLEVLDASFSFDGVVGAFAITNNLFVIAIGLGIGAMFVRSLTVVLVDRGTLGEYRFLEHGAFYAIGALAVIMFLNTMMHVSEVVTGLIGAGLIGLALISSIRHKKNHDAKH